MSERDAAPPAARDTVLPARLKWLGDQPFSLQFGDIDHAPDGVAEVERVFIEPQQLTQRLAQNAGVFTVGEIGFGTALNFAVIAQRHLARAPPSSRLHFITFEQHPIRHRDFVALATRRGRELPIYAELARHYPPATAGWHRRHLADGRVMLSIFFGDASIGVLDIVDRQRVPVDAWLLDGFAPDRNPELWSEKLWRAIAALSGDGSTLATFSAVGAVRRGLSNAGFVMRKVDQRPHKRHSLAGSFVSSRSSARAATRSVVVIGGGLAGASTARQLAQRGLQVTLLDASPAPPNRMAATLLHCRLVPDGGAPAQLRRIAYLYAQHWYDAFASRDASRAATGVLQFPGPTLHEQRLEEAADTYAHTGDWVIPVDPATASALAGLPVKRGALYFPHGRALDLAVLCDDLLRHPSIDYRPGLAAFSISTRSARPTVSTQTGSLTCDQIVLCAGAATNDFDQARYLELVPVWGQIERIAPAAAPLLPIVGDGFMIPFGSALGIGATYEHRPWVRDTATRFNLQRFDKWWFDLAGTKPQHRHLSSARGARAVASDRAPIVGGLFDVDGAQLPNLFVNAGHGSQGTVSAPFAAECITAEVCGEFAPARRDELAMMSSLRFRNRQARRGLRHGAR